MCGIAGLYLKNKKSVDEKLLKRFSKALLHRGPDDQTFFTHQDVGLTHTRLSIIDLEGGAQPLTNDKQQWLIANGEIYNHVELRERWGSHYHFQTQSDSEIILAAYNLSSDLKEAIQELRGMYAFALYDSAQETLILSRDLFGIKPLYYMEDERGVAFASEIKTLLDNGWCSRNPDLDSISEILQLRYGTEAQTPVSGIKRLQPGETLVVRNGTIVDAFITQSLPADFQKLSQEEALERLKSSLKDSVHVHLRSDVPYGLFLSGGLDSATVLSLMSRESAKPVRTFTIGFSNGDVHDARVAARKLSAHFGTEHEELTFSENDFWTLLPQVIEALDDPIFDPAMMPTFKMAKIAAQELKVVLCGEGGDELLAGYRRYQKVKWPQWMGGRIMRQKGLFSGTKIFTSSYENIWRSRLSDCAQKIKSSTHTRLQWAQAIDIATWLPNNLLTKLDRCLMAHSLEGRTPFLDPIVAQATYGLPDHLKVRRQWGKWILRQWMEEDLPLAEPFTKKRGFNVPVGHWVLKYKVQLANLLPDHEAFEGLCNRSEMQNTIRSATKDQGMGVWTLLVYALWYQRFIQGRPLGDKVFDSLSEEVRALEAKGADWVHVDVMDGHFVPNITMGPAILHSLKSHTTLPLDVHLMISPVDDHLESFAKAGAHSMTIHPEAGPHVHRTLQTIRSLGCKAGFALNPSTSIEMLPYLLDQLDLILVMTVNPGFGGQKFIASQLEKIRQVRALIDQSSKDILLEVDGGITPETAIKVRDAGADILVAGTSIFNHPSGCYQKAMQELRGVL
ncbi:uncharacterized protein LOC111319618 [Stylophora pistillata]|uniref:uncharacterized protein LOC111319618 n=1 Tax=Stylophora pistillata TaxID=50429 RepID=UPI000C04FDCA|nr:uncharacterized protein LOC111319618 [Stylophora pistillata]